MKDLCPNWVFNDEEDLKLCNCENPQDYTYTGCSPYKASKFKYCPHCGIKLIYE